MEASVQQARSAREASVSIEINVESLYFNCKIMGPCHQTDTAFQFIKKIEEMFTRISNMEVFLKGTEMLCYCNGKLCDNVITLNPKKGWL